jgi:hypothetical protein
MSAYTLQQEVRKHKSKRPENKIKKKQGMKFSGYALLQQ